MEHDPPMQPRTTRVPDSDVCLAVAHALRPRLCRIVAKQAPWPTGDDITDAAYVIGVRLKGMDDLARVSAWWEATGGDLTAALVDLRGIDTELASQLIGASVQAQISAGQDLVSDYVLRLAEAAAVWLDGAGIQAPVTA